MLHWKKHLVRTLDRWFNDVQRIFNTAYHGHYLNHLGAIMREYVNREYKFMIGEKLRPDVARVPFSLLINNHMVYQHLRIGKVRKRKRSHCGRNLYFMEFENDVCKFWWSEGSLSRPAPSQRTLATNTFCSTYLNRAYKGKCKEGQPFVLVTSKNNELDAYVSLLSHPYYSSGETIQVGVCLSPEAANRMHRRWMYTMLYGPLPAVLRDANLSDRNEPAPNLIHNKKEISGE